jgi:hypothetical protein
MKFRSKHVDLKTKIQMRLLRLSKGIYHLTKPRPDQPKAILFIIGCQRSGTTLLTRIFDRDFDTTVYGEDDKKVVYFDISRRRRLKPLDVVKQAIDKDKVSLVVLKPLLETQNTLKLLDYFENSKALWAYRHYQAVAVSMVKMFGNKGGIETLRPIVENNPEDWRAQHISPHVRSIVLEHFSEDMNHYDAAALFWFVRNSLFFELELDKNPKVMMCRYQDLVLHPVEQVKRIYNFVGCRFPGERTVAEVRTSALDRGKEIELAPAIEFLCQGLLEKLEQAYSQEISTQTALLQPLAQVPHL